MQNRMTEQKGAGNGKREEKEGNDCGNGLNDILMPFMVYYLVADIGMPVVIADVFDGISFITGFGCEKFENHLLTPESLRCLSRIVYSQHNG